MITLVSPSTHNCYKRFESTREENQRAMRGSPAVQAPSQKGSGSGKHDRDLGAGRLAPDQSSGSKGP